jgi:hypothetical protein
MSVQYMLECGRGICSLSNDDTMAFKAYNLEA